MVRGWNICGNRELGLFSCRKIKIKGGYTAVFSYLLGENRESGVSFLQVHGCVLKNHRCELEYGKLDRNFKFTYFTMSVVKY